MSLKQELLETSLDDAASIPWIVRLLENPDSKLSLPGRISLYNHDCLHIILQKDYSSSGEAFIVGFSMGTDPDISWIHILVLNIFSRYFYPKKYKFSSGDFIDFNAGLRYGKYLPVKHVNNWDFAKISHCKVEDIRTALTMKDFDLRTLEQSIIDEKIYFTQTQKRKQRKQKRLRERLRWSSSAFGIIGGFLLALNLARSGYGFVLLAASSFQLFISSCIDKDKSLIVYSGSLFLCVDLVGIYRWLVI